MRLLVILPALNEEVAIGDVIRAIPRSISGVSRVEILVIDDGSTDGTAQVARDAGADVVSHRRNLGLGVAIQSGLQEALRRGAELVVNLDADGQFDPADIETLLHPLLEDRADFVSASRFKDPALSPSMPWVKRVGNLGMSWLIGQLVGQRFHDVSCGFRAYTRETLLRLVLHGRFTYTQEMFLELGLRNMRIEEVPVKVRGVREHGNSRIASNLFRYGILTLTIIFSCVRDYRPGLFFNTASGIALLIALALGGFFLGHRLVVGAFSPHIWAGFTAAFLFGLAVLLFFIGQLALMLGRLRQLEHEQLYLMRRLSGNHDLTGPPEGDGGRPLA